jgi:hypothetical protein
MDDLTPGAALHDPVRAFWLQHPRLASLELLTTADTAAIVATCR